METFKDTAEVFFLPIELVLPATILNSKLSFYAWVIYLLKVDKELKIMSLSHSVSRLNMLNDSALLIVVPVMSVATRN